MVYNIGNVLGKCRIDLGMSRRELSENICSEKYVYMIEKGKRTPSTDITRMLGDKMGIDLFKYYEYLDCEDPIAVNSAMEKFNKYRMENDSDSLAKATLEAMKLADFQKKPWIYEIEVNKYTIKVLGKGDFTDSFQEIPEIISEIERYNPQNICIANFYVLLSTSYHMVKDVGKAKKAIFYANEFINGKEKIAKYSQVFVTVKICKISVHYLAGELDSVIEEGISLHKYEEETSFYERSHYTLFFLAFAYYQKGLKEIGIEWFIKALCASLIRYKPMDIYYLAKNEMFEVLIKDERIPECLAKLFRAKYSII